MKKALAIFMAIVILACSIPTAYAVSTDGENALETTIQEDWEKAEAEHNAKVEAAKEYAYRDISQATPEEKERIIAARNTIIFSKGWVVDGFELVRVKADGTCEYMPRFSELFPDWDIPTVNEADTTEIITGTSINSNTRVSSVSYYYYLKNPTNTTTPPFCSFYHTGIYVNTYVSSLTSSQTCNIGYTNMSTGTSLGWLPYLYPGDNCYLSTLYMSSFTCGVRASTYSSPGYGTLSVSHDAAVPV